MKLRHIKDQTLVFPMGFHSHKPWLQLNPRISGTVDRTVQVEFPLRDLFNVGFPAVVDVTR